MYHFVTVEPLEVSEEKAKRKRIRQHAIRNGIQNKKNELARRNNNFIAVNIDARTGKLVKRVREDDAVTLNKSLSGSHLDPFDTLPGDGERLRMLMRHS
jgi:hypothetical protein